MRSVNCLKCGQDLAMRDMHLHMASHDTVRIAGTKEHQESTKEIVKAKDERIPFHHDVMERANRKPS